MVRSDLNIVIGSVNPSTVVALFGEEHVIFLPLDTDMPEILTTIIPVFSSRSQARKAGWSDIPLGFSQHEVGKFKHQLAIFKENHNVTNPQ
jgi:hypothetical protein